MPQKTFLLKLQSNSNNVASNEWSHAPDISKAEQEELISELLFPSNLIAIHNLSLHAMKLKVVFGTFPFWLVEEKD